MLSRMKGVTRKENNTAKPARQVILLNPPVVDPTMPPHFAAYLIGNLRRENWNISVGFDDLNVETLNYLISEDGFNHIKNKCNRLRMEIEGSSELSRLDELRYKHSFKILGIKRQSLIEAKNILTNQEKFYDFSLYKGAAKLLERYVDAATAISLPGMISFWEVTPSSYGSLSSVDDLSNNRFIDALCEPFRPFFEEYIERLESEQPELIGISCNYISQLPYAIFFARKLSEINSHSTICIGGTEITDLYKNIEELNDIWSIFPKNTVLVIGEGETAFKSLVENKVVDKKNLLNYNEIHPNIITKSDMVKKKSATSENINDIGSPDYSVYDLHSYWSPEPVLMYSPTRGCYWNKCTFCDYGLNFDSPTSPSRQRNIEDATNELVDLSSKTHCIYLAVDAISPSYLLKLSKIIQDHDLGLSWSAEIRLENKISNDSLSTSLRKGGCIGLSFGFESASQRILDLIDKGVDISRVPNLLSALSQENIHVQLMGFVGFPSESVDEAQQTFSFLSQHESLWTLAGIGSFVLTPGSIIAKDPAQFGIKELIAVGNRMTRSFRWIDSDQSLIDGGRHDDIRKKNSESVTRVELGRPLVGGIDTAHSLLYFKRYPKKSDFNRTVASPRLDLVEEIYATASFVEFIDFWDVYDVLNHRLKDSKKDTTFALFEEFLSETRTAELGKSKLKILPNGNLYKLPSKGEFPQWISAHFA